MNEEVILTSLGGLKATLENQTKSIDKLVTVQEEQGKRISELTTSIEIYKGHSNICAREFTNINEKLGRDYIAIVELKKVKASNDTIDAYKEKKSKKLTWFIGILATIVSMLIGINQLVEIKNKVTKLDTHSLYAATVDSIKTDTTKLK